MEVSQGLFVLLVAHVTYPEGSVFCAPHIHITPDNPVIKLSSPLTFNCSSSCSPGKVKWNQMQDSVLVNIKNYGHYSTMMLQSITEEDTSFICEEKCEKKNSRATVKIYHFSGPNITTDPKQPEIGQPFQLKCKVKIHPELLPELKLTHGSRVLSTQQNCVQSDYSSLLDCEVSARETEVVSVVQYKCEAALRKDSSERIESASLKVFFREAAKTTAPPTETISSLVPPTQSTAPPTESPQSTAALVTKRVTIQTEQPNTQSSTAFKRSAESSTSSSSSSSSEQEPPQPVFSTVWLPVITCLVILGLVILVVLFFRSKKRKEGKTSEERRNHPLQ